MGELRRKMWFFGLDVTNLLGESVQLIWTENQQPITAEISSRGSYFYDNAFVSSVRPRDIQLRATSLDTGKPVLVNGVMSFTARAMRGRGRYVIRLGELGKFILDYFPGKSRRPFLHFS